MISQIRSKLKERSIGHLPSLCFVAALMIPTLVLMAFSASALAQGLTVDEIIKRNIAARGGASKWANLRTVKLTGTYVNFSDPTPFTIWRQRPDLYRFDTNRVEMEVIHAYDGEKAWWVNPLLGPPNDKPGPIPAKNNFDKVTLRERFFEPIFWYHNKKGIQVELAGKEDVDGVDSYKLEVTLPDSSVEFWYIDSQTFLENKMTGDTYDFGRKCELEVFFSDYRDVDGVKMPFLVESEYFIRYRSMEIDRIEINAAFDPAVFTMPDSTTWKIN